MSILGNLKNMFRKVRDDIDEATSDSERDMKYAIQNRKKQIIEWEDSLAELMAAKKGLERQKDDAQKEVGKYENLMKKAKADGNIEAARTAFNAMKKAQAKVQKFDAMIQSNQAEITRTETELNQAREEVDEVESNEQLYATQMKTAQMRQAVKKANSADNPLAKIKEIREKAMSEMDKADAQDEIDAKRDPLASLEEQYGSADADDEFAAFMAEGKTETKKANSKKKK